MATYPQTPRAAFMAWCAQHGPIFTANAAAIGLTPAQATAFNTLLTAAQTKVTTQENARSAFRNATLEVDAAVDALKAGAADTVRLIRAFAEVQTKPLTVYTTADIPPPATPTPMPPPGQPTNLTVTLTPVDGALLLRWKCVNPQGAAGTAYIVRRRLTGASEWTFIGVSGKKEFVDNTLVAGPDSVQYTVQGQRSDQSGPVSEIFTVNFGQNAGGGFAAVVAGGQGLEGQSTNHRLEADTTPSHATGSTVNGRAVQKVLPNGNGSAKRGKARV